MMKKMYDTQQILNKVLNISEDKLDILADFKDIFLDSYARLRIVDTVNIFCSDLGFNYNRYWGTISVENGSVEYLSNEYSLKLKVTSNIGDKVINQTHQYFKCQSGKSQIVITSCVFGQGVPGIVKRVGYFDDKNGIFFEQNGNDFYIVHRTSISGKVEENRVHQSNWNIDKMDGNGISGIVLDVSKINIFIIDFQWLGGGRVRCGINIGGSIYYCHGFLFTNNRDSVFISSCALPIRYEIENVGSSVASEMKQCSSAVQSEGGLTILDLLGDVFSVSTEDVPATVEAAEKVILAIRPKQSINGKINRGHIFQLGFSIATTNSDIYWKIITRANVVGGTWNSVDDSSLVEYSTDIISYSGGVKRLEDYTFAINKRTKEVSTGDIKDKKPLVVDADGIVRDNILIIAKSLDSPTSVYASLLWKEIY